MHLLTHTFLMVRASKQWIFEYPQEMEPNSICMLTENRIYPPHKEENIEEIWCLGTLKKKYPLLGKTL